MRDMLIDLKYIEKKNKKLEKEYEKKMVLENAEELTKQQIELDAVALEKQKLIDEMNELKGIKTEKKKSEQEQLPKVERKLWKYIPFTLLFYFPF